MVASYDFSILISVQFNLNEDSILFYLLLVYPFSAFSHRPMFESIDDYNTDSMYKSEKRQYTVYGEYFCVPS